MDEDEVGKEVQEIFNTKKLQERVWRLEAENKELKQNNFILHTQYTSQCESQSDILKTLHSNLDENFSKIEEQANRIVKLENDLKEQKQENKDKLDSETEQWNLKFTELDMKNKQLIEKLHEVSVYQQQKDQIEADLANLTKRLEDQSEAHQKEISAFDRKKAIEIDQLKKDMQKSLKETREMLKSRTKDQLDSTTKRTIMENEQMATELHFQSKETERLLGKNQTLSDENAQLKRNLHIHKELEHELARRTHVYQKLIKKMHQRQKAEASSQRSTDMLLDSSLDAAELSKSGMFGASQNVNSFEDGEVGEKAEELAKQVEDLTRTLDMVRYEFASYRRDHATLTQLQDQSTRIVIKALYELKNQQESGPFPPPSYDDSAPSTFGELSGRQKEYFFRVLLEKLNSSMCGACCPAGPAAGPPPGVSDPKAHMNSSPSLPQIKGAGRSQMQATQQAGADGSFSQFLWSVASQGGAAPVKVHGVDVRHMSVQTSTDTSDPCLKEGLWNPQSRSLHGETPRVTPAMVCGNVRNWGSRAQSFRVRQGKGW